MIQACDAIAAEFVVLRSADYGVCASAQDGLRICAVFRCVALLIQRSHRSIRTSPWKANAGDQFFVERMLANKLRF